MTLYTGGSGRFVASAAAPIATGWNESCRAGFAPAERPCLRTARKKAYVIRRFLARNWRTENLRGDIHRFVNSSEQIRRVDWLREHLEIVAIGTSSF